MANSKKQLRILCFGDSLTEGYTQHGTLFTPYSETLLSTLKSNLPLASKYNIAIDTDGMSGDLVTGSFLGRMEERCIPSLSVPPLAPTFPPPFPLRKIGKFQLMICVPKMRTHQQNTSPTPS